MENTSIDCTKIRNNSKRTKTSRNEVKQPKPSNNHFQPIVPKPCPQPDRFCQQPEPRVYLGIPFVRVTVNLD